MTAKDITNAIACNYSSPFYYRKCVVVPNVYWGMNINHECDILAVTKSRCAHEIEIKISRADMKRDLEKKHNHYDARIRCLWYAGPKELEATFLEFCPKDAGIILITEANNKKIVTITRKATPKRNANKFTEAEIAKLCALGLMRYWSNYEKIIRN